MLRLNQKFWNGPRKIVARDATIIEQYRFYFGDKLPAESQFWSICGQCTDTNGVLQEGCELHQLTTSGLLLPEQFYGVDLGRDIIDSNRAAAPAANWYCGDFFQTMRQAKITGRFAPIVVNADFINMPGRACGYLADIMAFLATYPGELMLIGNMVLEYQRFVDRKSDMTTAINILNGLPQFRAAYKIADWFFDQVYYQYTGTGVQSRTTMGTLVFRKAKS